MQSLTTHNTLESVVRFELKLFVLKENLNLKLSKYMDFFSVDATSLILDLLLECSTRRNFILVTVYYFIFFVQHKT